MFVLYKKLFDGVPTTKVGMSSADHSSGEPSVRLLALTLSDAG
jgi:hypothetical protein